MAAAAAGGGGGRGHVSSRCSRAAFSFSLAIWTRCTMRSTALPALPMLMTTGRRRYLRASLSTDGGIVALRPPARSPRHDGGSDAPAACMWDPHATPDRAARDADRLKTHPWAEESPILQRGRSRLALAAHP